MAPGREERLCVAVRYCEYQHLPISRDEIGEGGKGSFRRRPASRLPLGRPLRRIQQGAVCYSILLCPPVALCKRSRKGVFCFLRDQGVCRRHSAAFGVGDESSQSTDLR